MARATYNIPTNPGILEIFPMINLMVMECFNMDPNTTLVTFKTV